MAIKPLIKYNTVGVRMKNKSTFLGIVVLALIIIGTIYSLFIRPAYYKFNGGEVFLAPVNTTRVSGDFVDLVVIDDYVYECNKNGLIKKSIDGETVWTKGFYIDTPLMEAAGQYIAVANITGKSVYIFDIKGFIREIKESYPIINIDINKEGFLTTIQEKGKQNIIKYYNNEGVRVVESATRFYEDGYPIDVSTSYDVTKMVTGYLNISNNRLQTKISFFGYENQYDDKDQNLLGGFTYENALLSEVYWIDETRVLAIMDNGISIFDCETEPKLIKTIKVDSELMFVEATGEEIIVSYGKPLEQSDLNQSNNVIIYNYNGEELKRMVYKENIQLIKAIKEEFFVITDSQIIKYQGIGREWFASTYLTIKDFYEISEEKYVAVTNQGYEILKIRER